MPEGFIAMTRGPKRPQHREPSQAPDSCSGQTNPDAPCSDPNPEPADEEAILRDLVQGLREASRGEFVEESILDILREG